MNSRRESNADVLGRILLVAIAVVVLLDRQHPQPAAPQPAAVQVVTRVVEVPRVEPQAPMYAGRNETASLQSADSLPRRPSWVF
ncbi:MAG: hypothetical protein GAK45_01104 [Pseudomonas citronellolis]|nr:MAG: hypothetical protein GAK45_01104 [Pseudomonas citronellolis]